MHAVNPSLMRQQETLIFFTSSHAPSLFIIVIFMVQTLQTERSSEITSRWMDQLFSEVWPWLLLIPFLLQLPAPAEPLAALWRSRMTRWHSCWYRPDLTASAPSSRSRWPPSRGASPRRRLGDHGWNAAAILTMKMGPSPTVTWRRGNLCHSSMGTSLPAWCPPHWRTWTPTTAIRRSGISSPSYERK